MAKETGVVLLAASVHGEVFINKLAVFDHINGKPIQPYQLKCLVTFYKKDEKGNIMVDPVTREPVLITIEDLITNIKLTVLPK